MLFHYKLTRIQSVIRPAVSDAEQRLSLLLNDLSVKKTVPSWHMRLIRGEVGGLCLSDEDSLSHSVQHDRKQGSVPGCVVFSLYSECNMKPCQNRKKDQLQTQTRPSECSRPFNIRIFPSTPTTHPQRSAGHSNPLQHRSLRPLCQYTGSEYQWHVVIHCETMLDRSLCPLTSDM